MLEEALSIKKYRALEHGINKNIRHENLSPTVQTQHLSAVIAYNYCQASSASKETAHVIERLKNDVLQTSHNEICYTHNVYKNMLPFELMGS